MNALSTPALSASPPRLGRAKALAALGVVLLMLAAGAIGPHLWNHQLSIEIEQQTETAKRQEAIARRLATARKRLAALSDPKIAETMLLQGGTIGLYGASLQKQIAEIALNAGISPQSLRISDPEKWKEGLVKLSIEIGAQAPLQSIQAFLFDIETALPLFFVEQLRLSKPESKLQGNASAPLDMTLVVHGLALQGASP